MRCPACQTDNPQPMKFCGNCGTKLPALCPGCGAEIVPGFKFCGECGTPVGAAAPAPAPVAAPVAAPAPVASPPPVAPPPVAPPMAPAAASKVSSEGERKQVTVLHCELTMADAKGGEIHHEKVHALLNRFFELAQGQVQLFEGTVKQFLGNGFMALFGAPIAHEDHASRGVLAAVGVRQAIESWRRELEAERIHLELQLGLDTGMVVVGGVGDMIVGVTTNIASRLKQNAGPNEILVSEATTKMARGAAQFEPADSLAVSGQTITVYRVGTAGDKDDGSGFRLTPFVGRTRELGVLSEVLQLATQGQGQVVGITGEPGSGKSRLLVELRRRMKGRQVIYLQGGCLSYGSGIPYLPILNMVRSASKVADHDDDATVTLKLRQSLEAVGSDPNLALPYFLRLLDIEAGAESLVELEPQAIKAQTFQAMRQMIHNASQRALVVMEIEDLHWIDATSEDFLGSLVEGLGAARILLLCTYRSGWQPKWMDKSYATQLSLRRLSDQDSRALAEAVLEKTELPVELAAELLTKAEGNPFFLEELARALAERGKNGEAGSVPSTIQGVLMARIDRLPEDHKRLLQTASVLGREFPRELLRAVWDREGLLDPLLVDLKSWEFLFEQPSERDPRYLFKHALTQDVAYDSLLVGRRQTLHKKAAEAIEGLHAGRLEDAYDRLIYHYPRANEAAKTVHYLGLFASRAARNYAHAEAARALRESLEHAEKLENRDHKVLDLVIQLAESLLPLAHFPQTLEILKTYAGRVEAAADRRLAAKFHFWLAHTYSYMGDQKAAAEAAELSIALAREVGDEATEGLAHYVLGRDGFWSGKFAAGVESSLKAVVLLERAGEPWWQGQAYWVAGFNQYVLGQFEKAFESLLRAQTIGQALADPRLDPAWSIGHFYATLGEWATGLEYCNQAVAAAKDPLNGAVASGFLGHALLEKGDLEQATQILEPAMTRMKEAGMQQILGWFAAYLAEAYADSGRLDRAQGIGEEGLAAAEAAQFRYGVALAQRALGVVGLKKGDAASAETWLRRALETFSELETPFEIGRTWLRLAQTALARADRPGAGDAIQKAAGIFEKLYVPKYLEQTQRLAAEHGLA